MKPQRVTLVTMAHMAAEEAPAAISGGGQEVKLSMNEATGDPENDSRPI
jgi:hypothetical protein